MVNILKINVNCADWIILLSASQYSDGDYDRFGGHYYKKLGFGVVFISLFNIFYQNKGHIDTSGETYRQYPEHIYNVSSFNELHELFAGLNCNIRLVIGYVDFASPNINIVRLLRLAAVRELPIVFYHGGAIPITLIDHQKNIFERVVRKTAFLIYFKFLRLLAACHMVSGLKVVLGSKANEIFLDHRYISYKKYFAHTFDYETVFGDYDDSGHCVLLDNYVVFLDEFAPFHCDNELVLGVSLAGYADDYYSSLNRYFALIEAAGYEVIIAAHPRSRYDTSEYDWCFKGKKIVKHQTAKLVKDCAFCVGHLSTSFNYAVMFKKPIVQLQTKLYTEVPHFHKAFSLVTQNLNAKVVDIGSADLLFEYPTIDRQKYKEYMHMYIKTKDSQEKSIYKIFLDAGANNVKN